MVSWIYVIKIKQVLLSQLTFCVYQVTFFCMKCPVKNVPKNVPKKYACKLLCNSKKLLVTHGKNYYLLRKLCHTTQNINSSF